MAAGRAYTRINKCSCVHARLTRPFSRTDRSAYAASIDVGDVEADEGDEGELLGGSVARKLASYTAPRAVLDEVPRGHAEDDAAAAVRLEACLAGNPRLEAPPSRRPPPLFTRLRVVRRLSAALEESPTEKTTTASGG